jgi:hypothetical protein
MSMFARRCLWNRYFWVEDKQRWYLYGKGRNGVVASFCLMLGSGGKEGFGSDEGEVSWKREGSYMVSKWRYEANDVKGCMRFIMQLGTLGQR